MTINPGSSRFVERSAFFDGQRLFAADLQGVEEFNREMRWLHNQSLHQPGVGAGFAVSGARGDREVRVQPGYAIDAQGREIVQTESLVFPVPAVAGDDFGAPALFDLTVAYPDERALNVAEARQGTCGTPASGAIRLREMPVFRWVRLGADRQPLDTDAALRDALDRGELLRLARAQVLNCRLDRPLSLAQRRNARPPAQPYAYAGRVEQPEWNVLEAANGAAGFGVQLEAAVDTSSAAFLTKPCYTAQIRGTREFTFTGGGAPMPRLLDGFVTLLAARPTVFRVAVLIPDSLVSTAPNAEDNPPHAPDFREQLRQQVRKNWSIDWIGVES